MFDPSKVVLSCNSGDPTVAQSSGYAVVPGYGSYGWRGGDRNKFYQVHQGRFAADQAPASFAESFSTILIRPVGGVTGSGSWRMDGIDLLNAESWDLRQLYTDGC